MPSRIFLLIALSACDPINALCEKLDKTREDYEISYDDETSEYNCYGYVVEVDW